MPRRVDGKNYRSVTRCEHHLFWGKRPIFGWNFQPAYWILDGRLRCFVFYRFFVNISAILQAVRFIFFALRSGSLVGQLGVKIISPSQFWCASTFLPLRFCKIFQRNWIACMRFTIQVCFQIYSSYENKRALGWRKPQGTTIRLCVDYRSQILFPWPYSCFQHGIFLSTCSASQPKLKSMCSKVLKLVRVLERSRIEDSWTCPFLWHFGGKSPIFSIFGGFSTMAST